MKKNYLSMLIIYLLHLLLCILVFVFEPSVPFPIICLLYLCSLPVATALAGIVDTIIGLIQKDWCCRLFSLASGVVSIFILLIAHGMDFGIKNINFYYVVFVLTVVIWILWIIRGILFHRKHRDNA